MKSHKTDTALPTKDASEDFKAGTTERPADVQSSRFERSQPMQGSATDSDVTKAEHKADESKKLTPRQEIERQMEANNLWIAEIVKTARASISTNWPMQN
jgi:hypothetical protein